MTGACSTRVPYVWSDSLGTVGAVLNQDKGMPAPGEPMSPGVTPGKRHFIANYQPYMTLTEWETLKGDLKKEMPCKRETLADYYPSQAPAARLLDELPCSMDDFSVYSPPPCSEDEESLGLRQRYFLPAAASSARRLEARPSVQPRNVDPAIVMDTPTKVAGQIVVKLTPRREPKQRSPRDEASHEPPDLKAKIFGADSQPPDSLITVRKVDAKDTGPDRFHRSDRICPVADKDKMMYGNGRQMRPAREVNLSSKKRLNELLKLPPQDPLRIEAGALHSSRACRVIPSQNLRVV